MQLTIVVYPWSTVSISKYLKSSNPEDFHNSNQFYISGTKTLYFWGTF
jgi:hypothetical protein